MIYSDLKVGMKLKCNRTDGTIQLLEVVRKGIDGFEVESVVFQSTSGAQFYCKKEDVKLWRIEPF